MRIAGTWAGMFLRRANCRVSRTGSTQQGQTAGGGDGGANRNRTDDLLNAIQALSQLSYGPTSGRWPAPFPAKVRTGLGTGSQMQAASSAALLQYQAFGSSFLQPAAKVRLSVLVVVVANADHVGDVVVLFLVIAKEGVVVIVAEIDIVVTEIGQVVVLVVVHLRVLERNQDGGLVLDVQFLFLDLVLIIEDLAFLEVGARIALARVGRNDGIFVQIVEFTARFRVYAFGAKFGFCHGKPRTERRVPITALWGAVKAKSRPFVGRFPTAFEGGDEAFLAC